ncbi:MAG TPA: hypothetical protein VEK08_00640 [Planctomycetota bacterium]|nr:hypothetical protein [Planctomycetota bacterium]
MTKTMLVAALFLLSGFVFAADEPGHEKEIRTAADSKKASSELNPALKNAKFMEGRWKVEQQMKPQYSEKGGEAHGLFIIERDLNGNALVGRFEAEKSGKLSEFEGHLVISAAQHDAGAQHGQAAHKEHSISMFWADSSGNVSLSRDVRVEGDKLIATFDAHKHGDKMVKGRVTFQKMGDDKIAFSMEQSSDKGGWERVANATYTRAGDASNVKFEGKREMDKSTR